MTDPGVDTLVKQYKTSASSMTEKEKAALENQIWELVPSPRALYRRDYLKQTLNIPPNESEARSKLYHGGAEAERLWELIHSRKMALRTAADLFSKARQRSLSENLKLDDALDEAIEEYNSRPYGGTTQAGIPYRFGEPKKRKQRVVTTKPLASSDDSFWGTLQASLQEFVEKSVPNLDPGSAAILLKEFRTELKVLADQFQMKLRREAERTAFSLPTRSGSVTFKEVVRACELLHMDPPIKSGEAVDLSKAARQKRVLARNYHPDAAGDSPVLAEKYLIVMEAYETLEAYSKQPRAVSSNLTGEADAINSSEAQ
jgi:hypothetical protein